MGLRTVDRLALVSSLAIGVEGPRDRPGLVCGPDPSNIEDDSVDDGCCDENG